MPAHTRNDFHLSPKELEAYQNWFVIRNFVDYEPYEAWTGNQAKSGGLKFDFASNLFQQNKNPIILSNLDAYFDNVAGYTNTNFFSKDTIYVYSQPNNNVIEGSEKLSNGDIVNYFYGLDEYGKRIRLAKYFKDGYTSQGNYVVDNNTPEIHSDYWSRLAPKSILAGAGIIKLFKDEVKKAEQNPTAIQKPDTAYVYYFAKPVVKTTNTITNTAIAAVSSIQSAFSQLGSNVNNFLFSSKAVIVDSVASPNFSPVPSPTPANLAFYGPAQAPNLIFTPAPTTKATSKPVLTPSPAPSSAPFSTTLPLPPETPNVAEEPASATEISSQKNIDNTISSESGNGNFNSENIASGNSQAGNSSVSYGTSVSSDNARMGITNYAPPAETPPAPSEVEGTPTPEPTPQPEAGPPLAETPTPTPTPTPSPSPSPTPEPTPSPTPTPLPSHLVISEARIAGETVDDEFIELYNPTEQEIILTDYRINKKTSGGGENVLVINDRFAGKTIKPRGYLLLGRTNYYQGLVSPDIFWPESDNYRLADNNTIILYSPTGEVIDKVGWGNALDFEGFVFVVNPSAGQSLERKANAGSTAASLAASGADEYLGNGYDTNNNSADFVLQTAPDPQNSQSVKEPKPVRNISQNIYYSAIQTAINAAVAGDEIDVNSGTYYENVNINKRLTLKGIDTGGGKPIVDAGGVGSAVTLNANEITLEGFSAKNAANGFVGLLAGILVKSQKNIIKNNAASGNNNGIYLESSSYNNLSNNVLGSNDNGIVISSAHDNTLSDNSIRLSDHGIYLLYASGNTIIGNISDSNFYGIYFSSGSQNNIVENNTITNNNRAENSTGIYFYSSAVNNTITGNNIRNNSYGLFSYYSSGNIIYRNNIAGNTGQAYDNVTNKNTWNSDYPTGGNYWSDYAATATDIKKGVNQNEEGSDGIGDTPYVLPFNSGTDKYPRMSQYP